MQNDSVNPYGYDGSCYTKLSDAFQPLKSLNCPPQSNSQKIAEYEAGKRKGKVSESTCNDAIYAMLADETKFKNTSGCSKYQDRPSPQDPAIVDLESQLRFGTSNRSLVHLTNVLDPSISCPIPPPRKSNIS